MSASAAVASRILDIARSLDGRGCYVYFDRTLTRLCEETGAPLTWWVGLNVSRIVPDNNLLDDAHSYTFERELDVHVTLGYIHSNTPPDIRSELCGQLLFGVHTHLHWKLVERHDMQCLYLQDVLTTAWHRNAECFVTLSTFAKREVGNLPGRPYHVSIRAR